LKMGLERVSTEFPGDAFTLVTTEELSYQLRELIRRFRQYRRAVFYTYDFDVTRSILWHGIVWWLSRHGVLLDGTGKRRVASLTALIFRDAPQLMAEPLLLPYIFGRVALDLTVVESKPRSRMPDQLSIAYMRTDHWFGTKAGGSVTHIAGVANSFRDLGIPLFFLSSDRLELIDESRTPLIRIKPSKYIQNLMDAPLIAYNLRLISQSAKVLSARQPTIIYQRYSRYNYAGAYLAAKRKSVFVLEFNGSELWVSKHWGNGLRFPGLAERIEKANLRAADAIVVVSSALKQELISRGVSADKVLVNPNGVDVGRFDPAAIIDQSKKLRKELHVDQKMVVGFIGTFGPWHGVDILAQAVRPAAERDPSLHFLFIGDGVLKPKAMETVRSSGMNGRVSFTGMVPQELGPVYLGACDILVSPHVANPDGSPFFGSPTKLFEYMAMGKAIVASRLDQIGEILKHGETALLVSPGTIEELSEAILALSANSELRRKLGENARADVVSNYTWLTHTRRILEYTSELLKRNEISENRRKK